MNPVAGERVVALLCLAFCVLYGVSAASIEVFPGREQELITSRTFPYGLAAVGAMCSLWILFSPSAGHTAAEPAVRGNPYRWSRCGALVAAAIVYGGLITRLGFIFATVGFLAVGCLLLGERRARLIVPVAVLPPVVFWALLEVGLDIRLPSFTLWGM